MHRTTIAKAARQADVGVETIRFYERKALIERPPRPAFGGYREYPAATIERVRFIRQAQKLGFSLGEIGDLLSLSADPSADCADVRERARVKLGEVEDKISRLIEIRHALDELIDACPGSGALGACSIMESLMGQGTQSAGTRPGKEKRP
ncbi:MAG: MerR family DNA-binding protein [Rhodospirillales bacterium]|nr:MerR family DNA-binding protein [Rhodospirillales bacterium]